MDIEIKTIPKDELDSKEDVYIYLQNMLVKIQN